MDPNNPNSKAALRAAVLIHEQLAGDKCQELPISFPEYSWSKIQQLRRQIDLASRHGWHRAAARRTEELTCAMDGCRRELESAVRVLQSHQRQSHVAAASDIYRDILALADEFEAVDIDLDEHEFPGESRFSEYKPADFGAAVEYALAFARKNKGVRVQVGVCVPRSPLHEHRYTLFECVFPVLEPFMQKNIRTHYGRLPD
jgi:hypothetical protein